MSNLNQYFAQNMYGKAGESDFSIGERTFTNLDDELFGEGREGLFLENDVKEINIFGHKNNAQDFEFEGNFMDYLKADQTVMSEIKPGKEPEPDGLMQAVRDMYTHLNHLLERNGLPLLGNFWKINSMEIQKTLNLVSDLIRRRADDMNTKIAIVDENNNLKARIEENKKTVEDLKKERDQLK